MAELLADQPPTSRGHGISDWPVRRKVALVLAIPLLLAVALGALQVREELDRAGEASATASQVNLLGPAVDYLAAAEDAALEFRVSGRESQASRAALKAVNDAASRLETAAVGASLSDAERAGIRQLLTDSQSLRDGSAYINPSTSIAALQKLKAAISLDISGLSDTGSSTATRIGLVGQVNEGRLAAVIEQVLVANRPEELPADKLYAQLGVESAAIANLALALPDDADIALVQRYNLSNQGFVTAGSADLQDAPIAIYDEVSDRLLNRIEQSLATEASDSRLTAAVTAGATLLALLVAVIAGLLVSRTLVRPIRRVRDSAHAVATETLPEAVRRIRAGDDPGDIAPIAVTTHEETGQLARAVHELHQTAVDLAKGEAELRSRVGDMFVTLSRRNTTLVNQQLRLIERLESDEEDPGRLESLFRLDHLASRMRRTAESLVVLADVPLPDNAHEELSVNEALQGATAGVQDYRRVDVAEAPALRISGEASADVVHLLTELVDNALSYSPPTSRVTVVSSEQGGRVLIEVSDAGLGIEKDALRALNQELQTGGEVTADTARRMGLFVVSRLARRHGLTVSLEGNAHGGITARVLLPGHVVLDGDAPRREPVAAAPLEQDEPYRRPTVVPGPAAAAGPAPAPASTTDPAGASTEGDSLAAVINANIGLPQRRPGTAAQPEPLTSVFQREPEPEPEPEIEPEVEAEIEAAAPEPAPAAALAVPVSRPLDDDYDLGDADETPLFRMLRSSWFGGGTADWGASEADAGWRAVDHATGAAPSRLSRSGLPMRDPGDRLVPGALTPATSPVHRDPEAIRARLAAHAAGVARGRSMASAGSRTSTTDTEDGTH